MTHIIETAKKWLKSNSIEQFFVYFFFVGILTLNRTFVQIGFQHLYIVEVSLLALAVYFLLKRSVAGAFKHEFEYMLNPRFLPLFILIGYAVFQLARGFNGVLAIRHSVMIFYSAFLFLFLLTVNNKGRLRNVLAILIVFATLAVGLKLIYFKIIGLDYYGETHRVFHNEVDILAIPVAIVGLLVFRKEFWSRSKVVYIALCVIALAGLILPFKRTSFIGVFAALVVYFIISLKKETVVSLLKIAGIALLGTGALIALGYILFPDRVADIFEFVLEKLDITSEGNAVWRWQAWEMAIEKFMTSPIIGIGYGKQIINIPFAMTEAIDPHNSYLAFLVYNGIIGFGLFMGIVFKSFVMYFKMLRDKAYEGARQYIQFFLLGLTFCFVYPFFNVMLENQYQGIFFWFFLTGPYLIQRIFGPGADDRKVVAEKGKAGLFITIGMGIVLLAYGGLIVSPMNYTKFFEVYEPSQGGRLPVVQYGDNSEGQKMIIYPDTDGVYFKYTNTGDEKLALRWALPDFYRLYRIPDINRYRLVMELAEPIQTDVTFSLTYRLGGGTKVVENPTPLSHKVVVPLALFNTDNWLNKSLGLIFAINFGSQQELAEIKMEKMYVEFISDEEGAE